jgi:hypothetical protein
MHIEDVGNQVGYDGRAWAALRQYLFPAGDLGNDCGHILMQGEVPVLDEESADAAEVN